MDSLRAGVRYVPVNPPKVLPGWERTQGFARMDLDGDLEGWVLDAAFELDDGEVIHGAVTFTPTRRVAYGTLTAKAQRQLNLATVTAHFEDIMRSLENAGVPESDGWVDALTAGRKPGRRGQDPNVYLLWARRRVDAEEAQPNSPIKWMFKQWGDLYSEGAINKYVYMAREKGFLTPAGAPVALTKQAERLLAKGAESAQH